jgi:hypothetical protein
MGSSRGNRRDKRMAKINLTTNTKDKIAEAIIDILKMAIYSVGVICLINFLKDDVVKYIENYEKVKAIREVTIETRNERTDASVKLIRSAKISSAMFSGPPASL